MFGFLDMVAFYIRNHPQVPWVLAKGVTRILAGFRTFEILLSRVFLRYPHRIEIEDIIIRLCKPDDGFVSARKSAAAMQPVLKMPDNTIPHPETKVRENRIQDGVQGYDGPLVNVITDLPANAAFRGQGAHTLGDDLRLLFEVQIEMEFLLVFFAYVVGRRSND